MGIFDNKHIYNNDDEIQRNKINRVNYLVLQKILDEYEKSLENVRISKEKTYKHTIESLERSIEYTNDLIYIYRKLEASRVRYNEKFSDWNIVLQDDHLF